MSKNVNSILTIKLFYKARSTIDTFLVILIHISVTYRIPGKKEFRAWNALKTHIL